MAFYQRLQEDQKLASRFFNALKLKMQAAQNRIKADILSGTSNAGRATTSKYINVLNKFLFIFCFEMLCFSFFVFFLSFFYIWQSSLYV